MEHMQRAARDLIGAARAFLDAAEELVEDPDAFTSMADDAFTSFKRGVASAANTGAKGSSERPQGPGVEHIVVD